MPRPVPVCQNAFPRLFFIFLEQHMTTLQPSYRLKPVVHEALADLDTRYLSI